MPAPAPVPIPAARTAKFELVKSKQLAFALPWDNACSALFSRAEDSFRVKQLARLYCTNTFDWDERWLDRYRPQKTEDYINNMEKIARDRGGFAIMVKLERPRSLENEHVI